MSISYDPFALEFRIDPYPHYARLRADEPVYWAETSQTFVLSRYQDVIEVLKQPERYSSDAMATVLMRVGGNEEDPGAPPMPGSLVVYDPPDHTRLRSIVNRAFTRRRVEGWRSMIEDLSDSMISKMAASDRFDVIGDLAGLMPASVIAEIMGIGAEHHTDFKRWADTIVASMTGSATECRTST